VSRVIVLGYDDGEPARRALERAIQEAQEREAHVVVVAVSEALLAPDGPRNFGAFDDGPVLIELDEPPELDPVFEHARERLAAAGLDPDFAWAVGDPGRVIVDVARDRGAELVVIGAHHEGFFGGLFGGSVEDELRREAGCEVLVVE
jgi:nucleotide-binding universal stress UspA family protein